MNQIVLFCGNPGSGKSTLCNAIFGKKIFESGISIGSGLTQKKQIHEHNGVTYIDTPGLADEKLREKAAEEIEEALKGNCGYKIVFVATLEAGRIKPQDLETINSVCESIKSDFTYGLIFNKISKSVAAKLYANPAAIKEYLSNLSKQPSGKVQVLPFDSDANDEKNVIISGKTKDTLVSFIDSLESNNIQRDDVHNIDVRNYKSHVKDLEKKLITQQEEQDRVAKENKEEIKRLEEQFRQRQSRGVEIPIIPGVFSLRLY